MKRLDKLVLSAFIGPFLLTFTVVVFILLVQYMLKYFEDFVGKNLGFPVFAELLFYFSINMMPLALPLAVLLSSLLTFGNMGEFNELTAIKATGIPIARVMAPIFIFVAALTIGSLYFNDQIVPKANLKAFSLLYDIRQKKPALDIKPGIFYNGLPNYSVKANQKDPDGRGLRQIMIYDHTASRGNVGVTLADSGRMYTMMNERYLVLDLYRGRNYTEMGESNPASKEFIENGFDHSRLIFSLASFDMNRTQVELFSQNRMMRNIAELRTDVDSIKREEKSIATSVSTNLKSYFSYLFKTPEAYTGTTIPEIKFRTDSVYKQEAVYALSQARNARSFTTGYTSRFKETAHDFNIFRVEILRKYTAAASVLIMFMIGAPLGAIIRKGGFGMPVLLSIVFFVIYYIMTITGEKWAKEGISDIYSATWYANAVLLVLGIFFLIQARNDAALFEFEYYRRLFKRWFGPKRLSSLKKVPQAGASI
jgi:lipopolysaccharide export system permease protein